MCASLAPLVRTFADSLTSLRSRDCFTVRHLFWSFRAALVVLIAASAAGAQEFSPNVSSLGSLTCQQLWYLEHEVLAEGRVCLKSARARHAFQNRAKRCLSDEERILPARVRGYLAEIRKTGRAKNCPGF
jgi:hypothetical protein